MKKLMFSYYDKVTETYSDALLFPNQAAAIRWFKTSILGSMPPSVASDFRLCYLGTFEIHSGAIDANLIPEPVEVIFDDI